MSPHNQPLKLHTHPHLSIFTKNFMGWPSSKIWHQYRKMNALHSRNQCYRLIRYLLLPIIVSLTVFALASTAIAWQVTLTWDPNSSTPDGYRLYMRQEGQNYNYNEPIWQGTDNQCTITESTGNTDYYFVVRAFVGNEESGDSNEIRYTPTATNPIIDNGDQGTASSGNWSLSSGTPYIGSQSVYSDEAGATYTYEVPVSGTYEVALWWTYHSSRCSSVPVEIYDGDQLLETVYIDQTIDGGQWNSFGYYTFSGNASIAIHSQGGCTTNADGVRLVAEKV